MNISELILDYKQYSNEGIPENVNIRENIWEKSCKYKAQFADKIVIRYHKNTIFLEHINLDSLFFDIIQNPELFDNIINISLGNLAYISLYSPQPYNVKAKDVLQKILFNDALYEKYCVIHK
jgi:hypothetical protein